MTNKNTEDFLMSYLRKIPEDLKLGEERSHLCLWWPYTYGLQ